MTVAFHEADNPSVYRLGDERIGKEIRAKLVGSQDIPWLSWSLVLH